MSGKPAARRGDHVTSPSSDERRRPVYPPWRPLTASPQRVIAWVRPTKPAEAGSKPAHRSWIKPIERAIGALEDAVHASLDRRRTQGRALYQTLCADSPVFRNACGDDGAEQGERTRRPRSEFCRNFVTFIQALLASTDLCSGIVARPPAQRPGPWEHLGVKQLAARAFGSPVAWQLSQRRSERVLRTLKAMGLIETTQRRYENESGETRSETAVRRCTAKLFALLRLEDDRKALRIRRDRERGQTIQHHIEVLVDQSRVVKPMRERQRTTAAAPSIYPVATAPPNPVKTDARHVIAEEEQRKLRAHFGVK